MIFSFKTFYSFFSCDEYLSRSAIFSDTESLLFCSYLQLALS